MKTVDIGKKLWGFYSDAHTMLSLLKGGNSSKQSPSTGDGAKADAKGEGQMDERLTLTAFARAIERAFEECDEINSITEAEDRGLGILNKINSYSPTEIRCLSLTFGLQQSAVIRKIPQGKDKDGKDKKPVEKTTLQNKEGQDMFILLIRKNDDAFTKAFCDFAVSSTKIFSHNVALWQKRALDFLAKSDEKITASLEDLGKLLDKPFQEISLDNPNGLYKPPIWTDFMIFFRNYSIKKCRENHLKNLAKHSI